MCKSGRLVVYVQGSHAKCFLSHIFIQICASHPVSLSWHHLSPAFHLRKCICILLLQLFWNMHSILIWSFLFSIQLQKLAWNMLSRNITKTSLQFIALSGVAYHAHLWKDVITNILSKDVCDKLSGHRWECFSVYFC